MTPILSLASRHLCNTRSPNSGSVRAFCTWSIPECRYFSIATMTCPKEGHFGEEFRSSGVQEPGAVKWWSGVGGGEMDSVGIIETGFILLAKVVIIHFP